MDLSRILQSMPAKNTMNSHTIIYTRALPRSSFRTMAMIGRAQSPARITPRNFFMSSRWTERQLAISRMKSIFTNSDGCRVVTPRFSHALEPYCSRPMPGRYTDSSRTMDAMYRNLLSPRKAVYSMRSTKMSATKPKTYASAWTRTTLLMTKPSSYTVLSSIRRLMHPNIPTSINVILSASRNGENKFFIPKLTSFKCSCKYPW